MRSRALRLAAALAGLGAAVASPARAQNVWTVFQDGVSPTSYYDGTQDTTITVQSDPDQDPTAIFGSRDYLRAGGFPNRLTSLLRFQMDGGQLPSGSIITAAALSLPVIDGTTTGFSIYEVLRPWAEDQASYRRPSTGLLWADPGAAGVGTDRGGFPIASFQGGIAGARLDVPLTDAGVALVQRWYLGAPNHGLIIQDFDSWDGFKAESRESGNPPLLVVSYSSGAGAGTAWIPPSADTYLAFQPTTYEGWGLGLYGPSGPTGSLLRWDLQAIPPGVLILSAKMRVSANRIGTFQSFDIYTALQPWTVSANWTSYDFVGPWQVAGAQGDGTDRGAWMGTTPPCLAGTTCDIYLANAAPAIQGWVDAPASNHGFVIQSYTDAGELQLFDSEASPWYRRPALEISFTARAGAPPALFPASAKVSTGEQVRMMVLGGTAPYIFTLAGSSGGSIDASGLYTAGQNLGQDQVTVEDLTGAQALAYIEVVGPPVTPPDGGGQVDAGQRDAGGGQGDGGQPPVPDGGQPDGGSGADGGSSSPVSISLSGPAEPLLAQEVFAVEAEIANDASLPASGLVLVLAPAGLAVGAPALAGGGALPVNGAGYDVPALGAGQSARISIPAQVTARPGQPLSLTARVERGDALVASSTLDFTLQGPPPFETACGCGAGSGTLGLLAVASAIFTSRARRRRSDGADRSCDGAPRRPPSR